jgi:quercetin dioxygenase-like cupin family protein
MDAIFQINQADMPWSDYESEGGPAAIRYKALTLDAPGVPPVQYIEYGPGQTDPVHRHDIGEFFIVVSGEMWLGNRKTSPGGVIFIPANTDYAVRASDEGVRYFRFVTS